MSSVNKAIILGNLGADPEVKWISEGVAVASMSIATSEKYKNQNGETVEKTQWHRVVMWRKLAELAEKYLRKGSKVYIEGQIETRKWEDQDGNTRYMTEIIAKEMRFMGGGKSEENAEEPARKAPRKNTAARSNPYDPQPGDLPFDNEKPAKAEPEKNDLPEDDDLPF